MNIKLYLDGIINKMADYMAGIIPAEDDENGIYHFLCDNVSGIFWVYSENKFCHASFCGADLEIKTGAGPRVVLELRDSAGNMTAILRGYANENGRELYDAETVPEDIKAALFDETYRRYEYLSLEM